MEEFINLLQEFAFGIASAILPVIAAFVVAYLKALIDKKMAEIEASKPELAWYLDEAVRIAVAAAEKANFSGFVEDKKEYAITIAQKWLDEHGWDEFDIDILEAAIEAEVLKQFGRESRSSQS